MSTAAAAGREGFWTAPSRRQVAFGGGVAYALLLVRTAWISDDAYITFRTVMNALHGYGLRWNVADRVQTFTHPLWMFVMLASSAVTHEVYFTAIFVSIAASLFVVGLVTERVAASLPMATAAFSVFALSKSFVEYSTSGLENALTNLLLVVFVLVSTSRTQPGHRRVFWLSLAASLLMLNRLDTGLLVMPALGVELWQQRSARTWAAAAIGMAPLVGWEIFSVIYYGFPLPNTAYAKLGHGVPRVELLHQGGLYLLDSIGNDPITPLVILTAMLSPWALRCDRRLPAGIALYVAYVVWVGGDFMSGRFFSAPLLCAVVHLARLPLAPRFGAGWATAVALIWLVGVSGPRPVITSDASFGDIVPDEAVPVSHVTDERRYYYKASGLMTLHPGAEAPDHRWLHLGEFVQRIHQQVMTIDAAGFEGFGAGPSVRFIDRWGLGDPLIARLPAEVPWQIGHFARRIPAGYELTLLEHRNLIVDPGVGAFYEKLRIITEDPIWSRERFLTILRMNLGRYDRFVASYGLVHLPLDALDRAAPDGSEWNAPPAIVLTLRGLTVSTDRPRCGGMVELSASANDTYRLRFRFDEKTIGERVVRRPLTVDGRLLTSRVSAPDTFEWNTIDVLPAGGDSKYSVGHMRWLP